MSRESFQPGQIWSGTELTHSVLEKQWMEELSLVENRAVIVVSAFTEETWADLEWNAREALHLNGLWPSAPRFWRHLFLKQDPVNTHLMRSLQILLSAWQAWTQLPWVRNMDIEMAPGELSSIIVQAGGFLDAASVKGDSLLSRKNAFRQFSIRQYRLYQQISAFFRSLEAVVARCSLYLGKFHPSQKAEVRDEDIQWHTKELFRLVGPPDYRPSQWKRLVAPRLHINQLIGANCLYHSSLLRILMNVN